MIAWDGEGWGREDHKYAILAGLHCDGEYFEAYNPDGLSTFDCLHLIAEAGLRYPHATHVMYGAHYDWNQWMHDLSYESAVALHDGKWIQFDQFIVRYNGLWFEIRINSVRITIWDVFPFWQKGFVSALEAEKIEMDSLEMISRFKDLRGDFRSIVDDGRVDEIKAYNRAELEGLNKLITNLFTNLDQAAIRRPTALTGAGAIAGSLLNQHQVGRHVEPIPEHLKDIVLRAYAGGRVEALRYGYHQSQFYVHDLRSAYPDAMMNLPSLKNGEWQYVSSDFLNNTDWQQRLSVWHIRWHYGPSEISGYPSVWHPTDRYYPFFWRQTDGTIQYPASGEGWYWWPEVWMARNIGWDFEVLEGWIFDIGCEDKPFNWLRGRYKQRALLRDSGKEGAQQVLKLGLNALYGKLAQTRGRLENDPPRHQSLAWAGWITSWTRAKILEAMSTIPADSIVYCMTDSVASTVPLPDITVGSDVGQWEVITYDRAMVIQAGIAFLWSGEDVKSRSRGFDPNTIMADRIIDLWKNNKKSGVKSPLVVPTSRPVTLGMAVSSEETFARWNQWLDSARELDIYGGDGKRLSIGWRKHRPWSRLEPLRVFGFGIPLDSEGFESISNPYKTNYLNPSIDRDAIVQAISRSEVDLDDRAVGVMIG